MALGISYVNGVYAMIYYRKLKTDYQTLSFLTALLLIGTLVVVILAVEYFFPFGIPCHWSPGSIGPGRYICGVDALNEVSLEARD